MCRGFGLQPDPPKNFTNLLWARSTSVTDLITNIRGTSAHNAYIFWILRILYKLYLSLQVNGSEPDVKSERAEAMEREMLVKEIRKKEEELHKQQYVLLRINKFLEISPSTAFHARAVTGRLLCLQQLENVVRIPLKSHTPASMGL